jgi:hypothetical protein
MSRPAAPLAISVPVLATALGEAMVSAPPALASTVPSLRKVKKASLLPILPAPAMRCWLMRRAVAPSEQRRLAGLPLKAI